MVPSTNTFAPIKTSPLKLSLTNPEEVNIAVYEGDAILINKQGELFSIQNGTAVTLREKDNEQIISSDLSALEKINKLNKKFKRFNNRRYWWKLVWHRGYRKYF